MTDTTVIKLALKARNDIQRANLSVIQLLPYIEQEHDAVAFLSIDINNLHLAIKNIQRFTRYAEAVAAQSPSLQSKEMVS